MPLKSPQPMAWRIHRGPHEGISYPIENLEEMERLYHAPRRAASEASLNAPETRETMQLPGGLTYYGKPSGIADASEMVRSGEEMLAEREERLSSPQPTETAPAPPMERENFRGIALKRLPGAKDPYLRDPFQEATTLFKQRIDGLRQHIFRGIPRQSQLTPEQQAHFNKQASTLYEMCYKEANSTIDTAKEALSNMMSRFDKMTEERKAEEKKQEAKAKEEKTKAETAAKEARKPPDLKVMKSEKTGKFTWHEWNPETRGWKDTGKVAKEGESETKRIQPLIAKMNQLSKRWGTIDFNSLLLLPESERIKYLKSKTGDLLERIPEPYKSKYLELESELFETMPAGPTTETVLPEDVARRIYGEVKAKYPGLSQEQLIKKAKVLAKERGYTVE